MKRFSYMFQNGGKRIVSVLLAVLILASSIFIGVGNINIGAQASGLGNVLQVKTTKNIFFGQNVVLDAGKTYAFSYYYEEGKFVEGVLLDGNDNEGVGGATITVTKTVQDEEYNKVTYEFVAPENATSAGEGKVKIYLGIRKNTQGVPYHFYGFDVHAVDDALKTNLFYDASFTDTNTLATAEGTTGNWYKPYLIADSKLNSGMFSIVTLESVGGINFFKKPSNVLQVKTTKNIFFGQNVVLDAGKTYAFSYYYEEGKFVDGVILDGNDNEGVGGVTITPTKTIQDEYYNKVTYEFVAPTNATSAGDGKVKIYLGIRKNTNGATWHFYGFKVHAVDDAAKTNLFNDARFTDANTLATAEGTTGNWYKPYPMVDAKLNTGMFAVTSLESVGGINFFKKPSNVLQVKTTKNIFFGQNVVLDAGRTYAFSYYYEEGKFVDGVILDGNDNEGVGGVTITVTNTVYDEVYNKVTYEFVAPTNATSAGEGKVKIYLGIRKNTNGQIWNFYDFNVHAVDDISETNLFHDARLADANTLATAEGTTGNWYKPYLIADAKLNTGMFAVASLEAVGGISLFTKPAVGDFAIKLEPNSTGQPVFGQVVSLKAGKTYVFSHCYLPGTDAILWVCDGNNFDNGITFETVSDTDWSRLGAKFTVPDTAPDDPAVSGNKLIWAGFRGHKNANNLYYYDFKLYDIEDPQTNLLKDANLTQGGTDINRAVWKAPSGNGVSTKFSKVTLESIGGLGVFKKPVVGLGNAVQFKTTANIFFGQNVVLDAGKTYAFSYYYEEGKFAPIYILDGNDNEGVGGVTINVSEPIYDENYNKATVTFVAPANATSAGEGKVKIYVGIRKKTNGNPELFYGFDVHAIDDPAKTNLFNDALLTEPNSLNASNGGVGNWYKPYPVTESWTALNAGQFSVVPIESRGGLDIFKKPANVLQVKTTKNIFFGQNVVLDAGRTYAFSYYYEDGKFVDGVFLDGNDNEGVGGATITVTNTVQDEVYNKVTYEFVAPTNATPAGDGKVRIYLGIRKNTNGQVWNFYDFNVHAVDDPSKTNLFNDARFTDANTLATAEGTTGNWYKPYPMVDAKLNTGMFAIVSLESVGGMDFFKKPVAEPMVLELAPNSTGMPYFGQWVDLKKGETYVFSYYHSSNLEEIHPRVYLAGAADYDLSQIACEDVVDPDWYRTGIKFTVPTEVTTADDGNGNAKIWIGMRGYKYSDKAHFYGFNLYNINDENVNLLADAELLENGENINKSVWMSPWSSAIKSTYSKVTLKSIGGVDIFKKIAFAEEPMALRLDPNSTGQPFFGQWITLEKGKTYIYSNYYLPGTDAIPKVYLDANATELSEYEIINDKNWSKRNLKFTVPGESGTMSVWVGMRGYKYDGYLYFYGFELYDVENPTVNLMQDSTLQQYGEEINKSLWISPYNTAVKTTYSKVTLESIGGIDIFKRTGDTGPKMMYYSRTERGPNHETYGCFTFSIPAECRVAGQNYVFEFDARSFRGLAPYNFRCGAIVPELAVDDNKTVEPASIDGYRYSFNLRFTEDTSNNMTFLIFVPQGAQGYISNIYMYKADENFNKVSDIDMLKGAYGDFSHLEVGNYVELWAKQGACVGTDTGKLESVTEYYFDKGPNVPVPAGDKMMSYSSVWGDGTIVIKLPHTIKKGSMDGKNYIVSIDIRPTEGRDPSKFHSTGVNGEHVQVYPALVDGYTYTFNLAERYDFSLVLEFPGNCEGYISNLRMYEADEDFKQTGTKNLATAFGEGGKFAKVTMQEGMQWPEIKFNGGFVNTFIDTRAYADELKNGKMGEYHASGALWPVPTNYFVAESDTTWADKYAVEEDLGSGTIYGRITDYNGKPLSGYTVLLKSMQDLTNIRKAVSDKNGGFRFDDVEVGAYDVCVLTKDGAEILGDMPVWVDEDKDIVTLGLAYNSTSLKVDVSEDDLTVDSPEDNSAVDTPEDNSTVTTPDNQNQSTDNDAQTNNWLWWVIAAAAVVILAAAVVVVLVRKKAKSKAI